MVLTEYKLFFEQTLYIYKIDILMYALNACLIGHSLMIVHKKRQLFVRLHQQITDCELLDDGFFDQCQILLRKNFKFWATFFVLSTSLTILIPLLVAFLTEAEFGTLPTLFFPFLLPWASNTITMYACTMFIQMVLAVIPLFVIATSIFLSLYFEVLLIAMCEYMKKKISIWDQNNKKRRRDLSWNYSDGAKIKFNPQECPEIEELQHIFRTHQFMKK
ncbi:hypothetical protein V9T40_006644 [Parthenolecanium corni]|uniref:Uncharacterized protein n=1 Tax=Parthenolecanium corni TaxID=536013 RepID=A0AAN9TP64_9HEMI